MAGPGANLPEAQLAQVAVPGAAASLPGAQSAQLVAPAAEKRFGLQLVHAPELTEARSAVNLPAGHLVHSAAPGKAAKLPAHSGQTEAPAAAARPSAHTAQATAAGRRANRPAAHAAQSAEAVDPTLEEYVPGPHLPQLVLPALGANAPAAQKKHRRLPAPE